MKEKKPINVEIGQNVKNVRENAGLTQERFAEMLGLGEKHISAIERGAVGLSLATLQKICALLSVPADMILFGVPEDENNDKRTAALQFITERLSHMTDEQFWTTKDFLDKLFEIIVRWG